MTKFKLNYTKDMKKIFLPFIISFSLIFLSSCFQSTNSNSNDQALYGERSYSSDNFEAAFNVIESKCINCHTGYHNDYIGKTEENDWFAQVDGIPLVSSGSIANSYIMQRLKVWGTTGGMPLNDDALSESEYNALKTWIEGL